MMPRRAWTTAERRDTRHLMTALLSLTFQGAHMKKKRGNYRNINKLGLVFCLFLLSTTMALLGQGSRKWIGTWELNLEESIFRNSEDNGPPWKSRTWSIAAIAGGIAITDDLVPAKGAAIHQEYTVPSDGTEVPLEHLPDFTISFSLVDDNTFELMTKTESSSSTERFVVSSDGNSLTHTFVGVPTNTDVYDKQP